LENVIVPKGYGVNDLAPDKNGEQEELVRTGRPEYSILQSKNLTFASYNFSEFQENVLTRLAEQIQLRIVRDPDELDAAVGACVGARIPLYIEDFPAFQRNMKAFSKAVFDIRKLDFGFRWKLSQMSENSKIRQSFRDPDTGRPLYGENDIIHSQGSIITMIHQSSKNRGVITVDLNPWALPFLLYYGKGVGGTKYDRDIALSLSGKYSKRLYKMICDWATSSDIIEFTLNDFCDMFMLPKCYSPSLILHKIILPSKKEIDLSRSKLKFECEPIYDEESKGTGRKSFVGFCFILEDLSKKEKDRERKLLQLLFEQVADAERRRDCARVSKEIKEAGMIRSLISKFLYYGNKRDRGEISKEEFKNTMLKILREKAGVDLRSWQHIVNSNRAKSEGGRKSSEK